MEFETTVDELLRRWQRLKKENEAATIEDLSADVDEDPTELRKRLTAVASMISFLEVESEPAEARASGTSGRSPTLGEASPALDTDTPDPSTTVLVPGYEALGELGRGGMGVVYKARQQSLDRVVALKMILAASHASPTATARFLHEAKTIALLKHKNVVQVYEFGSHEGHPFFSLEFLEGGSLAEKLMGEPQPPTQAAQTVRVLAEAVEAAHKQGIVHRDLKPANVLLAADGTPKITDFGVAKQSDSVMTATGEVLGTPSYMAPEQASGKTKQVGIAADIYALGAILYEMLTGRPPFKGASAWETIQLVTQSEPVSPCQLQPRVPRDLETICLKCLEKEPAKRYASATELARDLGRFLAAEPIHARPVGNLERVGRWCLRNKAWAISVAMIALSLLTATAVSLIFAFRADQAFKAEAERGLGESKAKREAVEARRDVQQQLIDLSTTSGLAAARDGDHALALLWFARTAQLSGDDSGREALSRIRYGNWLRHVWIPEGTFGIPGFRHDQDRFRQVSFSSDGNYVLASAGAGDRLIWDRALGRPVQLAGPAAHGLAAAWDPKSSLLAVGDRDGKVALLAPPSFAPVQEIPSEGNVTVLMFSRDGRFIAAGGDKGAWIWDREKKALSAPFLPHGGPVATLAFSLDGKLLATSARDGKARVFRVVSDSSEPLFPPVDHFSADYGINHGGPERVAPRFAAGGQTLLTVVRIGGRYQLQWRSAATGKILGTSEAPPGHDYLSAFEVSPDGERVFVGWNDGIIRMCDARTRAIVASAPTNEFDWCEDLIFSADGRFGVSVGHDMKARSWLVHEGRDLTLDPASAPVAHPHQTVRVALSPDGRHMAVALWDGRVCLWRCPEGPPVAYEIDAGGPTWVALSPDKTLILLRGTSFRGGTLRETQVHDASSGQALSPKLAPGGIVIDAAFSPDGTLVAIAALTAQTSSERAQRIFLDDGKAGNVQVWDWKHGRRIVGPVPLPAEPRGLTWRPDGKTLALVCADYRVVLLDAATGVTRYKPDPGIRTRPFDANLWTSNGEARFSPDGRFLLTWERVPPLHVWDPENGQLVHTLQHTERVEFAVFNNALPRILATGGRDSTVKIWDVVTGKLISQLAHPRWIQCIEFAPGGTEMITGCSDDVIRTWNWQTGELRRGIHYPYSSTFAVTSDRRWLLAVGITALIAADWRTGATISPSWRIEDRFQWGLTIPAGDRRAIVGSFFGKVTGFDLEKLVMPTAAAVDEMNRLAELAAGRRIMSNGSVVPLSSAEWAERWEQLRHSGEFRMPTRATASVERTGQ